MSRIVSVSGRAVPIRGDDIDTDRIIPARFLKAITFEGLEHHLFADERAALPGHALNDARYAGATIMLVNRNFGCGSSREHAAQAIYRHGIRAIVGESFSEIFFGNCAGLGVPCVRVSRADAEQVMAVVEGNSSLPVVVDVERLQVTAGSLTVDGVLPSSARDAFLTGAWDATGLLLERPDEIDAVAARLPYLRGFAGV
jgi:3-isopropylmalate/(R)-2-methylmalate dehydratase small subunit